MQSYYEKLVTTDGVFAFDLDTNQIIEISEARPNYTCVADKLQPDHRNENPVSETSLATVTRAEATVAHVDLGGTGTRRRVASQTPHRTAVITTKWTGTADR